MDGGLVRLAFINVLDEAGRDVVLAAEDVLSARETQGGSIITLRSGGIVVSQTTAAAVKTAIDTLWDEFIVAHGDPV